MIVCQLYSSHTAAQSAPGKKRAKIGMSERKPDPEGDVAEGYEAEMREYENDARAEYEADMRADYEADMPSPDELAEMHHHHEESKREQALLDLIHEELEEFRVKPRLPTSEEVASLVTAVENAEVEEDIQSFLTENPHILVEAVGRWGHRTYVLPKPKLGADLVPDYLIARTNSMGVSWQGIELERTSVIAFTKKGLPSAPLTQAVQQVIDWREWLKHNIDYAQRPRSNSGRGLVGIDGDLEAVVVVGRRGDYPPRFNAFRRQTDNERRITIRSYDGLIEAAASRSEGSR